MGPSLSLMPCALSLDFRFLIVKCQVAGVTGAVSRVLDEVVLLDTDAQRAGTKPAAGLGPGIVFLDSSCLWI